MVGFAWVCAFAHPDQVDLFLSELGSRMDRIQNYGNIKLDVGIHRALMTLERVRAACPSVSGEVMDIGRVQTQLLVDILEARYNDVLTTKETLEAKAYASIRLMEGFLAELENRAQTVREVGITGIVGEGRRRAEESLKTARVAVDEGFERARLAKAAMRLSIDNAIQRARESGLLKYEDLPIPWQGNPYIHRGYRFSESVFDCLRSAFQLSNETVNIWSHAIGLVIILSIAFYIYPTSAHWQLSSKTDVFFAALFFFAASKCLICSTMWHTMNSIANQTIMERFACVDYTGISLLIAASIMTTEYTAFYCEPISRWTYIVMTAVLGVAGVIVPWHPFFNRADMSWARVVFYVSLGATGFLPVIQLNLTRGPAWAYYFYAPIAKSLCAYVLGAVIYAAKIPEKYIPGQFDYIGGSHNIWHFAVLFGMLFHYSAMHDMFSRAYNRAQNECSVTVLAA